MPVELEAEGREDDRDGGERHGRASHPRLQLYLHIEQRLVEKISVLRIRTRIHRIHVFLGLLDPDPLVRGMDPDPAPDPDLDPSNIKQK